MSRQCDRPLVVRCGAFGDMVLITTLIRDLSVRFGRAVDVLTSGPWSEPLLTGQAGVGEILCVRSRKTPYWLSLDQQRAVRRLRSRGVGPTWFCDGNEAARPMLARAGFRDEFIVYAKDHPLLPGEHATQQWRRLSRILPAAGAPAGAQPDAGAGPSGVAGPSDHAGPRGRAGRDESGGCHLDVSDGQRADLEDWLRERGLSSRPLIAVQAGNKRTMRRGLRRLAVNSKYWPNERWAVVLRHLRARHPSHAIVLLGTGPEFALNREIMACAGVEGLYNAAADLAIPRLVALLAHAEGLVTVDSGPAHAGAAVGCPQVVLFGRASTSLYRPWGSAGADVKVLTGQMDGEPNMLGIEARDVMAAWDALELRATAERSAYRA
ncbi:MAG TPA: glycosyltransferase family 9 protein [Steroidobacteraceae bacterium]|nr:glycosyltransferase family 9 protein [Steroidobacteraceae bacterium]